MTEPVKVTLPTHHPLAELLRWYTRQWPDQTMVTISAYDKNWDSSTPPTVLRVHAWRIDNQEFTVDLVDIEAERRSIAALLSREVGND